jgi:hypothetical protein
LPGLPKAKGQQCWEVRLLRRRHRSHALNVKRTEDAAKPLGLCRMFTPLP